MLLKVERCKKEKNKRFLQAHHHHFHISSFPFQVRQCATAKYGLNFHFSNTFANDSKFKHCNTYQLGCPEITPSVKCSVPEAFSGAKLQVFMENGQKNEID